MPLAPVYLSSISILPGIMFYTKHGRLHTLPRGKAVESPELQYASPLEALRQDFLLDKQHSTGTPKTMPIEKEVELTYRLQIKRRTLVRKDGDLHQMSPLWILLRAQSYPNKLDLFWQWNLLGALLASIEKTTDFSILRYWLSSPRGK